MEPSLACREHIAECLAYIQLPEVKEAFTFLVDEAINGNHFELTPQPHGEIERDVTYVARDKSRPYAVTPAQKWLRFYIRHPRTTHPKLTRQDLEKNFNGVSEHKQAGTFSFRIHDLKDAERTMLLITHKLGDRKRK